MDIKVTSTAFGANQPIPRKYTKDGEDVSPALSWTGVPAEAKELALICDDPDAPQAQPWVHWVIYKIPPSTSRLPEGIAKTKTLDSPAGAMQGINSYKDIGYGGPQPPRGHGVHHYHFYLYALNRTLSVQPGITKDDLLAAMKGAVISRGELIGTYERK